MRPSNSPKTLPATRLFRAGVAAPSNGFAMWKLSAKDGLPQHVRYQLKPQPERRPDVEVQKSGVRPVMEQIS